jgi:ABC-type Zn uptake system ZnuABC Zn-binding protein ZnuA
MWKRLRIGLPLSAALLAGLAVACGADVEDGTARPQVVASTGIIADLARRVAGDDAEVTALIPAGVDPHSFAATPEAARRVARADLLLLNGCRLEGAALELITENRAEQATVVVLAAGLTPRAGGEDDAGETAAGAGGSGSGIDPLAFATCDPHFWLAVTNARHYVERIRDALAAADPAHSLGYQSRADVYLDELAAVDAELRATVARIPQARRTLVVFHDAFGYLADAYGLRIVAAVLPAGGNQQPSAGAVAGIVRLVRGEGVPAVFSEPQFAAGVLDTVAREAGVRVLPLYSDAFAGDVDSYVALMRANARALAAGLGGG